MNKTAIYLNGVYEDVLEEILQVQEHDPSRVCFLQPYSTRQIKELAQNPPSKTKPTQLYISTTKNLDKICYIATIVGWENKQELSRERLEVLNQHIETYQPNEKEIYLTANEKKAINLISIIDLQRLSNQWTVAILKKVSNKKPLKPRTQAGNWAYVHELPTWLEINETVIREQHEQELEQQIKKSESISNEERRRRLSKAPKKPELIQVISQAYRRNPDVIVEVLKRANGKCEYCAEDAPFIRAKDDSPYLEIHHKIPLSEGGDDTIENAMALCPNCHRKLHYGKKIS